jgi:hypothetical protein
VQEYELLTHLVVIRPDDAEDEEDEKTGAANNIFDLREERYACSSYSS